MTIDEAIRINTVLKGAPILKDDPIVIAALNLNIEALKWLDSYRDEHRAWKDTLLPGETKE